LSQIEMSNNANSFAVFRVPRKIIQSLLCVS